jgi:hypothetical protein
MLIIFVINVTKRKGKKCWGLQEYTLSPLNLTLFLEKETVKQRWKRLGLSKEKGRKGTVTRGTAYAKAGREETAV